MEAVIRVERVLEERRDGANNEGIPLFFLFFFFGDKATLRRTRDQRKKCRKWVEKKTGKTRVRDKRKR